MAIKSLKKCLKALKILIGNKNNIEYKQRFHNGNFLDYKC